MTDARSPLRILHAVRAPVGGIFRHILDLANGQADRGHQVGIIADSLTGGERAAAALAEIAPRLKLGVHRIAIRREPHPTDVAGLGAIHAPDPPAEARRAARPRRQGRRLRPHDAARPTRPIRVYTPHGGSLHYPLDTLQGRRSTPARARADEPHRPVPVRKRVRPRHLSAHRSARPKGLVRCVFNGVTADEFDPVVTADDATDVVYVGEFRHIKGADILIDAVARLRADGKPVTLTLAGDGEETDGAQSADRDGSGSATPCASSATSRRATAFRKGALLVVPSRGDSMPYVVIEAAAAGIPMIAANVGGIPEIFGSHHRRAVRADIAAAMADAIEARAGRSGRRAGARQGAARADLPALLAEGDGRGRARAATATRLPNLNHFFTNVTVSSDFSAKPGRRGDSACRRRIDATLLAATTDVDDSGTDQRTLDARCRAAAAAATQPAAGRASSAAAG